jgi:hypothetical protein
MKGRIAHTITKGKNKEKPQNVIYLDSESWVNPLNDKGQRRHTPYLICANFVRYKKNKTDYWKDYPNNEVNNAWHDACHFTQYKTTTYIYAHNMGYDLIATSAIPNLESNNFRLISFFEKGGTLIYKFIYEELDGNGERVDGHSKTIVLLSTTNYYADTLANIGEVFGVPKHDYEFNGITEAEAIAKGWKMEDGIYYCRRDVEVIKVAMEHLFAFIDREDLGVVGKTAASQSFNAFRHRFMEHEIFIHTNKAALKLEREAYYGGRVECWHIGEIKDDDFYYVDVNSMYPYVMKTFNYPVKILMYTYKSNIEEIKKAISMGDGVIAKVKVKVSFPYFPKRKFNKLIFPVGEYWTSLATPELEIALENNLIIEVAEASFYEMKPLFKEFVDYFYNKRLDAKKIKDKIHTYFYKLLMNCLYGKFGQLAENWEEIGKVPYGLVRHETVIDYQTNEQVEIKMLGGTLFKKLNADESFNSFPAIAAHVTSQARIHLLKHILIANPENIYYMDTDSLFTCSEGYNNLKEYLDDNMLGKMKIEMQGDILKINAPKDYFFRSNIIAKDNEKSVLNDKGEKVTFIEKRKGISKDAKQLTLYQFIRYVEEQRNKLTKKDFKEFIYSVKKEELTLNTQWCKSNTFINEGQMNYFYNINRIKRLSRKYNKGVVLNNGNVIPFEIHE